jgi:hypothetical protein
MTTGRINQVTIVMGTANSTELSKQLAELSVLTPVVSLIKATLKA